MGNYKSCFKCREEVNYKRKAVEIFNNNMEKKLIISQTLMQIVKIL